MELSFKDYLSLIKRLNKYSEEYYIFDSPSIPDSEYDELYKQIEEFEAKNPQLISPISPTQKVGADPKNGFKKVKHLSQLWSLDNVFFKTEFKDWVKSRFAGKDLEFLCEPKFDGASLNLIYENGELKQAITRGNGQIGEDVTKNSLEINGIPKKIKTKELIEIRGEVIIPKKDFEKLNKVSEKQFANPRNTASGTLRQLNSEIVRERNLLFLPHGIGIHKTKFNKQSELLKFIINNGFRKTDFQVVKSVNEVFKYYQKLLKKRKNYFAELDGIVVKINDLQLQDKLGTTIKSPKWAIAFKFPAVEKVSKLLEVIWQIGRTGVVTPVARIEPVEIGGVIIRRVTLHNILEIQRLNLKIGADIVVVRRGDVIPKIVSASGGYKKILPPTKCPSCGFELYQDKTYIICQNLNCPDTFVNRLEYFAKMLKINGLGKKIVERLIEYNLVTKYSDLFKLRIEDIKELPRFGVKSATKIIKNIQSPISTISLAEFISSLNINLIGKVSAKQIAEKFGVEFWKKDFNDFKEINGFGVERATQIDKFLKTNSEVIQELLLILKPKFDEVKQNKDFKIVAITGKLSVPRKDFLKILEKNGHTFSSTVSKKVDFLVVGDNPGSKIEKAKANNIKIISESEFIKKFTN